MSQSLIDTKVSASLPVIKPMQAAYLDHGSNYKGTNELARLRNGIHD